jgi:hypothetical protein
MSTAWTITFDCADPAVLSAFWCQALGYVEGAPPAGFATWEEWLASVGVPPEEWGEVRWARVLEAVARLTEAGATVIREDLQDGVPDHFVMADPEGNEFCVL